MCTYAAGPQIDCWCVFFFLGKSPQSEKNKEPQSICLSCWLVLDHSRWYYVSFCLSWILFIFFLRFQTSQLSRVVVTLLILRTDINRAFIVYKLACYTAPFFSLQGETCSAINRLFFFFFFLIVCNQHEHGFVCRRKNTINEEVNHLRK